MGFNGGISNIQLYGFLLLLVDGGTTMLLQYYAANKSLKGATNIYVKIIKAKLVEAYKEYYKIKNREALQQTNHI